MADIANLDPGTRQSVQNRIDAAQAMEGDYNKAVDQGFLKPFVPDLPEYGGSQGDAINRRANKALTSHVTDLQSLEKAQYLPKVMGKKLSAHEQGVGVMKFDLARKDALQKLKNERKAQRAALMGSILGLAGAVAGAYFGGPAGSAAGGAAGKAAGEGMA